MQSVFIDYSCWYVISTNGIRLALNHGRPRAGMGRRGGGALAPWKIDFHHHHHSLQLPQFGPHEKTECLPPDAFHELRCDCCRGSAMTVPCTMWSLGLYSALPNALIGSKEGRSWWREDEGREGREREGTEEKYGRGWTLVLAKITVGAANALNSVISRLFSLTVNLR